MCVRARARRGRGAGEGRDADGRGLTFARGQQGGGILRSAETIKIAGRSYRLKDRTTPKKAIDKASKE